MKLKIFFIIFLPTLLMANVVWPALYLVDAILTAWVVILGLFVEIILVKLLFRLTILQSIEETSMANLASAFAGILLIPIGGLLLEIFPGLLIYYAFHLGSFSIVTWILNFILAAYINATVEGLVYTKIYKINMSFKSKEFFALFLINIISVNFAAIVLTNNP